MSFQQGLSGLNAASAGLSVIGNNVANASTVGFKRADANFSDIYAASLGIGAGSQVGIGVAVAAVQQQFTQGNLTTTNDPLDLALNGSGFFRMSNGGEITYTRNGQFHLDQDGYVINDQRLRLTGYPVASNGEISPSNPIELQLSAGQIPPRATSDALSGNLVAALNLDSRAALPATAPFAADNPLSYNFSTALNVFDTLGVVHNLSTYYVRTDPTADGEWDVYATLDGDGLPVAPPVDPPVDPVHLPVGTLDFDSDGRLTSAAVLALPEWPLASGAKTSWSPGSIDFTGSTQYGNESTVDRLTQGGYTAGSLVGIGVSSDGVFQGRYSNGQARNLGTGGAGQFRRSERSAQSRQQPVEPDLGVGR
jgi:flagellar hook protein FlgE